MAYVLLGLNNTLEKEFSPSAYQSLSPLQEYVFPETNRFFISVCFRSLSILVRLFLIGNCQLLATLSTPSFKNQATTFGGHAGAEAKLTISFDFAWLVRTLHY